MKYKLIIKNLKKDFIMKNEIIPAIKDISINLKQGEILGIVGTSGCGKSTLLNIIAGLEDKTGGDIEYNSLNPKISYMFQNDTLLPWRSVLDNACLGLELLKEKDDKKTDKVKNMLKEYGLDNFLEKKPNSLSGGMRQRVALIRSIATNPDLLLLDEPFSALDYFTRIKISDDVHKMLKTYNISTIIITHDVAEAICLCDRIIVLSSRPSYVKNIYEINLPETQDTISKRSTKEFCDLYEKIWRDLDDKV